MERTLLRKSLRPAQGAKVLAQGGLLLLPTETVWGLACGLGSAEILFKLKGRDPSKPAALAFPSAPAAKSSGLFQWSGAAEKLAVRFLPGPLTLVLPGLSENLPAWVLGEGGGVGLRVPDHEEATRTLEGFGAPVILTSANPSGAATPSGFFPDSLFPDIPAVETERLPGAMASTVVSLLGPAPRVLREGVVSGTDILRCLAS